MEEIFEQFKDKDAFDAYWKEHYVPLTYEDVYIISPFARRHLTP